MELTKLRNGASNMTLRLFNFVHPSKIRFNWSCSILNKSNSSLRHSLPPPPSPPPSFPPPPTPTRASRSFSPRVNERGSRTGSIGYRAR